MKVQFLASFILGATAAAASSKAKNKLRRIDQNAADVHLDDIYTLVSSTAQHQFPRILKCDDSTLTNFVPLQLGASNAPDSLYNNVKFQNEQVDISASAEFLLKNDLMTVGFVQSNQYFGQNGEYTQELLSQHQLLTKFWKVEGQPRLCM
jgi:hypothetical protein